MTIQDDIFKKGEGDRWFERNAAALRDVVRDPVLSIVDPRRGLLPPPRSICEVGAANGWRLAELLQLYPEANLAGFDPSARAIADGAKRFAGIELAVGTADCPPFKGPFDVVIVSFVLHWIDRSRLARSIAAIDDLITPGGYLVISDFAPGAPCRRRYHHRQDVDLFTWKQDYPAAFTNLGTYRIAAQDVFSHKGADLPVDEQDRASCTVLAKTLDGYRQL